MDHVPTGENRCIEYCLINRALDGMCIGLVTVDPSGRILWANRAALRLLGTRLNLCEGEPLLGVIRDRQLGAFWKEASESEDGSMGEVAIAWPRPAMLKASVTHCFDRAGEMIGRALLVCDAEAEGMVELEMSSVVGENVVCGAGDNGEPGPEIAANLTPQELRVLRLVGQGLSNEDIARRMFVMPSTVRSHLKHVYRKTGLKSRTEAVRYANRNGFD